MKSLRLLLAALIVVALPMTARGQKQVVSGQGVTNSATLSAGVRVGDLLYLSGQLPGRDADSTIESQTKSALEERKEP